MAWRRRKAKGSPDGGQFAPDTAGATNIPTPADLPLEAQLAEAGWSPEWQLEDYARKAELARALYAEQVKHRETVAPPPPYIPEDSTIGCCAYCGNRMTYHAEDCGLRASGSVYASGDDMQEEDEGGNLIVGRLPTRERLNETLSSGPATFMVSTHVTLQHTDYDYDRYNTRSLISGTMYMSWAGFGKDLKDKQNMHPFSYDASELTCFCDNYRDQRHCEHIDVVVNHVRNLVGEEPRLARWSRKFKQGTLFRRDSALLDEAPEEPVQEDEDDKEFHVVCAAAQQCMFEDSGNNDRHIVAFSAAARVEAAAGWRTDAETLYIADEEAFNNAMQTGRDRRNKGLSVVGDLQYEDVLDGACKRGSGQAFGMEIEYDFPAGWGSAARDIANEKIAEALWNAGVTDDHVMKRYGASRRNYTDQLHTSRGTGTWSLERDSSVSGELVTSGLYDEPATWERLENAVAIIKQNGGIPSRHTGGHVHVGTDSYQRNPATYAELMRLAGQNEDAFVVLSTNPAEGEHRRTGYALPVPSVPSAGWKDIMETRVWQLNSTGRESMVNLLNCGVGKDHPDHAEFRAFDGTLDPAVMQFQVKLAVAMTNTAVRRAAEGGTVRPKEEWGSQGYGHPEDSRDTRPIRSLLDTVFRRTSDKAQGAALAGVNSYTSP